MRSRSDFNSEIRLWDNMRVTPVCDSDRSGGMKRRRRKRNWMKIRHWKVALDE